MSACPGCRHVPVLDVDRDGQVLWTCACGTARIARRPPTNAEMTRVRRGSAGQPVYFYQRSAATAGARRAHKQRATHPWKRSAAARGAA